MNHDDFQKVKKARCKALLDKFANEHSHFEAVLLSSHEGLLLTHVGNSDEPGLMAAISSSALALADKLSEQVSDKLLIESKKRVVALLHVENMTLTLIGDTVSNAAVVLTSGNKLVKTLETALADPDIAEDT